MIISSIEDVRKKEIPLWVILSCGLVSCVSVIYSTFCGNTDFLEVFLSILPGAFLLFASLLSSRGVGFGDGFLLFAAGPALGVGVSILGLIIALFASSIFSGILIIMRKAGRGTRIPFVPFMALGMGAMILETI
jgi:prepilin signal peptidase PulO-like enzyme (type II secretory pathway)